jgi:hypothetical protein
MNNILNLIEEYGRGKNKVFLDLLISMHQATGRSFSEENKLSQRKIMVDKLVLQGRMLGAKTGDFYNLLLSELSGVEYTPHNPFSKILLDDLKNTNSFKFLFLDDLNMETKLKLFKKEIIPLVDSLTVADRKSQPKKKNSSRHPKAGKILLNRGWMKWKKEMKANFLQQYGLSARHMAVTLKKVLLIHLILKQIHGRDHTMRQSLLTTKIEKVVLTLQSKLN